jgi:PAS domain S-box-containing protein
MPKADTRLQQQGKLRSTAGASATLLASIVNSSDDAIDSKTLDGVIMSWNPAAERMYGYTADEILGKNVAMLSHPDRPEEMEEILRKIRNGERVEHYETVRVRKDGRRISISLSVSPILDDAGNVLGVSSIARDITERAPATLLASIVNSSDDAIDSKTLDGIITSWNPAAEQMYGYSADEIIGKHISMLSHPDRPEEMEEILGKIRSGERVEHYETVRVRKDGRRISISLSVSPILDDSGKVVGVSSIARDITERTGATKTLLASIVNSSDDAIDSKTLDGIITTWNPAAEHMYGYSADEILGKNISILSHPDRPEEMEDILAKIRDGGRVEHYETVRVRKDGRTISISLTVSPILDDTGKIVGVSSISRDITERKRADEQLRAASQYARSLIEASLDPLVTISPEGKITDVNEATIKVTGVARERLIGTDFSDYFTEPEKAREGYQQVFSVGSVTDYPLTIRHNDGRLTDVLYNASVYKDARGKVLGVFAAARDVTEQKAASQYARSLIEASLDPLVTISPEGKITDVNEATAQVTGALRERLIATDFSDYFTEPEKAREGYKEVFEKGAVTDYPLTIRHRGGKLTDVLYNASVYKDARGNVLGVFAAARDVTAQKQASQYARSLVEASLDPLVTISSEGKITDVNEATIKVTGVSRERLIGTDFSDYFTEPEKAREGYQQVFSKGFVTDYPLTIRHRNESLTNVLYNASVYKDVRGNVLGVFAAARDVTAQKKAEQEVAEQRTRELERLAELERFQRLTVGRELKMIELKKEIEELRRLVPADRLSR